MSTLSVVQNARGFVDLSAVRASNVLSLKRSRGGGWTGGGKSGSGRRPAKKRAKREVELRRAVGCGWPGLWRLATIGPSRDPCVRDEWKRGGEGFIGFSLIVHIIMAHIEINHTVFGIGPNNRIISLLPDLMGFGTCAKGEGRRIN